MVYAKNCGIEWHTTADHRSCGERPRLMFCTHGSSANDISADHDPAESELMIAGEENRGGTCAPRRCFLSLSSFMPIHCAETNPTLYNRAPRGLGGSTGRVRTAYDRNLGETYSTHHGEIVPSRWWAGSRENRGNRLQPRSLELPPAPVVHSPDKNPRARAKTPI